MDVGGREGWMWEGGMDVGGREGWMWEGGRDGCGRKEGEGGEGGRGGRERHVEVCIPHPPPSETQTELCTFCSSVSITLLRSLSDDLSTIGPLVVPSMCSLC